MTDPLNDLVAGFWRVPVSQVTDDLAFNATMLPGFSSLRFYRFLAAVESQLDVRVADPVAITTVGALRAAIAGS